MQKGEISEKVIEEIVSRNLGLKYRRISNDVVEFTEGPGTPFRGIIDEENDRIYLEGAMAYFKYGSIPVSDPDDVISKLPSFIRTSTLNVVDRFFELAMVSDESSNFRGEIFDLNTGMCICPSMGLIPSTVSDTVTDESLRYFRCYEGATIRAFKYKGKVFLSTFRKINPMNSRWEGSESFTKIMKEHGPSEELMFPPDQPYEGISHTFIVVDPSLQTCSRNPDFRPRVIYIRSHKCCRKDKEKGEDDKEKEEKNGKESLDYDFEYPELGSQPKFHVERISEIKRRIPPSDFLFEDITQNYISIFPVEYCKELTIGEANNFLRYGYYSEDFVEKNDGVVDIHRTTGEAIIAIPKDPMTMAIRPQITEIRSNAYSFRSLMRGGVKRVKKRLFQLLDDATKYDFNYESFASKYILTDLSKDELERDIPAMRIPRYNIPKEYFKGFEERAFVIFLNLLYSLPFEQQKENIHLLEEYRKDVKAASGFMTGIILGKVKLDDEELSEKTYMVNKIAKLKSLIKNSKSIKDARILINRNLNNAKPGELYEIVHFMERHDLKSKKEEEKEGEKKEEKKFVETQKMKKSLPFKKKAPVKVNRYRKKNN